MRPLISTADLAQRLEDPSLRTFDCTTTLIPLPETGQFYFAAPCESVPIQTRANTP